MTAPNPVGAGVLLLYELALLCLIAVRGSRWIWPAAGRLERCVSAAVIAVVTVVISLQCLLLVGHMTALTEAVLLSLAAAASLRLPLASVPQRAPWRPDAVVVAVIGLSAVVLVAALVLSVGPNSIEVDTLRYHLSNAAHWVSDGSMWTLPVAAPGDPSGVAPGDGELLGVLLMLPFHSAVLAYVPNAVVATILTGAVELLARRLGAPRALGAVAALGCLLAPISWTYEIHSLDVDLVTSLGIVVAALTIVSLSASDGPRHPWAIIGVALGLALGTKLIAAVPVLALLVSLVALQRRRIGWHQVATMLAGGVLLSGAWYARDWILTGSPIFPAGLRIAGLTIWTPGFDAYTQMETSLLGAVTSNRPGTASLISADLQLLGLSLVWLVAGWLAALRAGAGPAIRWMAVAATLAAVGELVSPFTGAVTASDLAFAADATRYALPMLSLAAAVGAAALPKQVSWLLAAVIVAPELVREAFAPWRFDLTVTAPVAVVAVLAGGACVAACLGAQRLSRPGMTTLGLAAAAVVVAACGTWQQAHLAVADSPVITRAAALVGRPQSPVIEIGVWDQALLLGPLFDRTLVAAGTGTQGALRPLLTASALDQWVSARAPVVVAVSDSLTAPPPPGWSAPRDWVRVGVTANAVIYAVGAGA